MQQIIAITGGIGSGKSVVSSILRNMGYKVYDSDHEARMLMDSSNMIKESIQKSFGNSFVTNGLIDRKKLSEIVFSDIGKLHDLNHIVHGAVIKDFIKWARNNNDPVIFIETAILYQSGLNKYVTGIWEVTAPENIRIERVMKRNRMSEAEVKRRIDVQGKQCEEIDNCIMHQIINNNDETALMPQILYLLDQVYKSIQST